MEELEIWKKHYCLPYEGSNLGNIRSLERTVYFYNGKCNAKRVFKSHLMTQSKTPNGYLQFKMSNQSVHKSYSSHRFIWECFNGPIPDNKQINHKDEDKTNNFVYVNIDGTVDIGKSNLELVTPKENVNYGTARERIISKTKGRKHSEQHQMNIEKSLNKPILQYTTDGIFVKEWKSATDVQKTLGYNKSNINKCLKGHIKRCYGSIWRYKEAA